jgi:integrative and conjugative element protein (TIGR02256 family)
MVDFLDWGERVDSIPKDLANPQILGLLHACQKHPHFRVVELRRFAGPVSHIGIVVEAGDGTIAPKNEAGILPRERLCLSFRPDQNAPAEVRALRAEFPDVIHLNGVDVGQPASLCLYENWAFEERRWTPQKHLSRILWWLRCTADGTLHAQDQSLEQLFYATGITVVFPADFNEQSADNLGVLYCHRVREGGDQAFFIVSTTKSDGPSPTIVPLVVDLTPVGNIPIQRAPGTLGALEDQLAGRGLEFQGEFEAAFKRQFRTSGSGGNGKLLLIVRIPRLRDGRVERLDSRGFLIGETFDEVGIKLGVLFRPIPGGPASVVEDLAIGGATLSRETAWRSVPLVLTDLRHMPSRQFARALSGVSQEDAEFAGVLAGVGSLGASLAEIWAREAWGHWSLIDPDVLAPHNLVRHVAPADAVGFPKAQVVSVQASSVLGGARMPLPSIVARANDLSNADVARTLRDAQLLVDASTTIEVPRDWSEQTDLPRGASVFFTHSGMSSVLLLEDKERKIKLSSLEAQYYRAILNATWGEKHLERSGMVRVGAGCRDHSLVLPFELVEIHSAQLARRLRKAVASENGAIQVWTLDDNTGAISAAAVEVCPVKEVTRIEWRIRWDAGVEERLHAMRDSCLPSETGGVLVGVIDQKLRTITIVDASDAPPDSSADATSFVRGEGGQDYVSRCEELTSGMVSYVGEWHSHPVGHTSDPSGTDHILLATLASRLASDGIPALMAIVSEREVGVSLGEVRLLH